MSAINWARSVECARCGLTPIDLPDGIDPEALFERGPDGQWYDQGCLTLVDQPNLDP